ncbi:MAG: hypothetical protein K5694_02500 [Bacilli bacterium]|nr:hypothetical protein [Bacilli bacterium]
MITRVKIMQWFYDFISKFFVWLRSVPWDRVLFIVIMAGSLIAIGLFILTFVRGTNKKAKAEERIALESSSVRLYRLNVAQNEVEYRDLKDFSKITHDSLDNFYQYFPTREQPKVRNWVSLISEGEKSDEYLETIVYLEGRKEMAAFFRIVKVDRTLGVIQLERYLIHYEPLTYTRKVHNFSSTDDFTQAINTNGAGTGMTFCFSLLPKRNENGIELTQSNHQPKELIQAFQESIAAFVRNKELLIQMSDREMIIANLRMTSRAEAIEFALKVNNYANRMVVDKSKKKQHKNYSLRRPSAMEVRCGVVSNKDLIGDTDAILTEARRTASSSSSLGSLSFYVKGQNAVSQEEISSYRDELKKFLDGKQIAYSYRPVYWVRGKEVVGYLGRAEPLNSAFKSIEELKNYAVRAQLESNLFSAIAKGLIPRFANENSDPNSKLFFQVRASEMKMCLTQIPRIKDAQEVKLVFLFREDDLSVNVDTSQIDDFIEDIDTLKSRGYGCSLLMKGKYLLLDSRYYDAFDDFFVGFNDEVDEGNIDTQIRSELHALVEKLLKYHRPIIATGLRNWGSLELIIRSGINYISSDVFAPYDTMLTPITERNIERISDMIR